MERRLPPEIIQLIGEHCCQADACNFALTCRTMACAVAPRLYRSILFDTSPRSIAGEHLEQAIAGLNVSTTVVRTVAGVKQCLRVLASHPDLAAQVWALDVRSNLQLSDSMMNTMFTATFTNLRALKVLRWSACPELPLDLLALLPDPAVLQVLDVDLAVRPWQQFPALSLPSLRQLVVRPFLHAEFLTWLSKVVSDSPMLEDVWLCRYLDSKTAVGSSYAFVGLSDVASEDVLAIKHFFPGMPRWKLRRLGLLQVRVSAEEADELVHNFDLSQLTSLALTGGDMSRLPQSSVLMRLMAVTPKLRRLELDWTASSTLMTQFILRHPELESLKVHVKECPRVFFTAIGQLRKLKHLQVVLNCKFSLADCEPLTRCVNLETLAIPFSFESHTWALASTLPRLKLIELNYSSEGTTNGTSGPSSGPASGLVSGGGLVSSLLTVVHEDDLYPLQYAGILGDLRRHYSLEHVQIDHHLHTIKQGATDVEKIRASRRV